MVLHVQSSDKEFVMKRKVYGALLISVLTAVFCSAAPEPAIVPAPGDWTVSVTFEQPQQIVIPSGIAGRPRRFLYIILTLANNTNKDVDFYPRCELMTDTFQILPAGIDVPLVVFERIKERHKSRYPFLESLERVDSKILQGEDNAKDIAIIWPDFYPQAKGIKLFITGLSNETVAIDHPVARNEMGAPVKVFLRKTLELSYDLKGDPALRTSANIVYKDKRWIMR
jgi:hypothetical protein